MMKPDAQDMLRRYHTQVLTPSQCGSNHVQTIDAPIALVWSVVSRFDKPQAYKRFIRSCTMRAGSSGGIGSVRELLLVTGLPAKTSTERLDDLDDDCHVIRFSIMGGDHRLNNYQSTMTLHESKGATVVIESYVVDVPSGSSEEDTCLFTDTIIQCNLRSLAQISEHLVSQTKSTL